MLKLSICVVAYNEESYLPNLLNDIKKQKYPHEYTEVVLVDSDSTDNTKSVMNEFQNENNGFYSVHVLDNPKKIQATGWNVAITHTTGNVIARIDAHSKLPEDYSVKVMAAIESGEDVVGGIRPCLIEKDSQWARTLLATENSLFGSSPNKSRRSTEKTYVKTLFHAAYRREVFDKAGLFREDLLRTEDNEMHYRIRQSGYKILYDPEIISYQYARPSLKKMIKQKYGNGLWIGKTVKVCPGCISFYHMVPFVFVLAILFTTILAEFGIRQLSALMWGCYALFAVMNTIISSFQNKFSCYNIFMPFLFLILHVSYGIGTLVGLFSKM